MKRKIILIACVSKKGDKKAKAKDLYKSELFKSSYAYAVQLGADKIYILSALHHLLDLNTEIEPYNVTLSNVPKARIKPGLKILTPTEKITWGKVVLSQLAEVVDLKNDEFIILAGQEYIKPIAAQIANLTNPLVGMGQGYRVQYLKNNTSK